MKLRFNRQEMADSLTAIGNVAATRTPKEVLRCVKMEAKSDVVLLSATDLEISLRCAATQVEVSEPGDVLVVADTFARIVRECPDEVLNIETKGNALHVRGSGSHFQIVIHDGEDFPPVPGMEGAADFSVDGAVLRRLIEWTAFSAARESTRYAINGILWEIDGTRLTLAATDGRRLSVGHGVLLSAPKSGTSKAIVPTKAMTLFTRLSADPSAPVDIRITDNQMTLRVGSAVMSSALVEGQFPDYRRVVPEDCDRRAELSTSEFASALKRAALLTNEESKGVRLSFSDGDLTLSSRAPEQGEATVSLPVRYKGETMEIGFNPVFLLDVLRVTHSEDVAFMFRDSNRPGVFKIGDDFLYVVMPVNLTSA